MTKVLSFRSFFGLAILLVCYFTSTDAIGQCPSNVPIAASVTTICNTSAALYINGSAPTGSTFQWFKVGVSNPVSTQASFTIPAGTGGSGQYYLVTSTPSCGTLSCSPSIITIVDNTPVAAIQPDGPTTFCGAINVNLSIGTPVQSYSYQWKKDGVNLTGPGSTSAEYPVTQAGSYTLQVINSGCPAISNAIVISSTAIDKTLTPTTGLVICTGSDLVLNAVPGYQGYVWYKNGSVIPDAPPVSSYTVTSPGVYKVKILHQGCTVTSDDRTVTSPAAVFTDAPVTSCLNESKTYITEPGNTNYLWSVVGGTITSEGTSTNSSATIQWTTLGTQSVSVKYTTPDGCERTTVTQQVQVSTPPTSPITAVNGLKVSFPNKSTLLEVVGGADATSFAWSVAIGPGTGNFINAFGTKPRQKVNASVSAAGNYTLNVSPEKNGCAAAPFEVQYTALEPALLDDNDEIVYYHTELSPASSTPLVKYLYLPKHDGAQPGCYDELGPVTIRVTLDEGDLYNLGTYPFTGSVHVVLTAYSDTPGSDQEWSFSLNVKQTEPEQMFEKTIVVNPNLIKYIQVKVDGYTSSNVAVQNVIRFRAKFEEEDIVDPSGVTVSGLNATQDINDLKWEQTFSWSSSCSSVTDYLFQLIRKQGDEVLTLSDEKLWKTRALQIQTESSATSLTLSMAEGTGTYYWRVIPLGNRKNGIGDPANWGTPSAPAQLNYIHPEDNPSNAAGNKNWIYSRTFTEGNRVAEKVSYGNGLQQIAQQQTRIQDDNRIVASQTIQDFLGRNAITSLPIPVAGLSALGYVNQLLTNNADNVYTANDFDGLVAPLQAKGKGGYYSGAYVTGADNQGVASAGGYPFSQTIFTKDLTGRVAEQTGVGYTHSKAGGKTVRTFYSHPMEGELVAIFGMEAPDPRSVQKIYTIDANGTTSVSFQTKDGKVIATALAATGSTGPLTQLTSPAPAQTYNYEDVTNNQRVNDFTVVSRTPLLAAKDETVNVTYELTPTQLKELCSSTNDLVGYYPLESSLYDASNKNHHASSSGTITPTLDAFNRTGGAYSMSGSNGMLIINDGPDFDFGAGDFTVSFWAYRTSNTSVMDNTGGVNKWNDFGSPGTNEWAVQLGSGATTGDNKPSFSIESGTTKYTTVASNATSLNVWFNIVAVRKGTELRLYINGSQAAIPTTIPAGTVVNNVGRNIWVGRYLTNYSAWRVDDIQIYKRGLEIDEIGQLYNRSTVCKTCDYKVDIKLFKTDDPTFVTNVLSTTIQAGECKDQSALKYPSTNFNLPILGGVGYVLEKRITLNNYKSGTQTLEIDSHLDELEQYYRQQITTRFDFINDTYLSQNNVKDLYKYLDTPASLATKEGDNYVYPLLLPGASGCQEYLYIPIIDACPEEKTYVYTSDCGTRDPNTLEPNDEETFEKFLENHYNALNDGVPVEKQVKLRTEANELAYMFFTNQYPTAQRKQYFDPLQFNTMMHNLVVELNTGTPKLSCETIWKVWENEVVSYDSKSKLSITPSGDGLTGQDQVDYMNDLQNFNKVTSGEYSLLESFLGNLEGELQGSTGGVSDPTTTGPDICTNGRFIPKNILYGKMNGTETSNALSPNLDYAYSLVYYNSDGLNLKNALRFYAHITATPPAQPAEPTQANFDNLLPCEKYRFSKSSNLGDQGFNQTTPEEIEAKIQEQITKVREKCGQACEGRKEEFRQALIQNLFGQNPSTKIEHYNVYQDNFFQGDKYIGKFDESVNTDNYTLGICEFEAMVDALVENCKNYCNTPLTTHTEVDHTGGRIDNVTVYGTDAEWARIKMPTLFDFELQVGNVNQSCGNGFDVVLPETPNTSFDILEGFTYGSILGAASNPATFDAVFTVTNLNATGQGSIFEAITNANAYSDAHSTHSILIKFNLQTVPLGTDVEIPFTIAIQGSLTITADHLTIDGTTQPGFNKLYGPAIKFLFNGMNYIRSLDAEFLTLKGLHFDITNSTLLLHGEGCKVIGNVFNGSGSELLNIGSNIGTMYQQEYFTSEVKGNVFGMNYDLTEAAAYSPIGIENHTMSIIIGGDLSTEQNIFKCRGPIVSSGNTFGKTLKVKNNRFLDYVALAIGLYGENDDPEVHGGLTASQNLGNRDISDEHIYYDFIHFDERNGPLGDEMPAPSITDLDNEATGWTAEGTALPGSTIELFIADIPGTLGTNNYYGRDVKDVLKYLGVVVADTNGHWIAEGLQLSNDKYLGITASKVNYSTSSIVLSEKVLVPGCDVNHSICFKFTSSRFTVEIEAPVDAPVYEPEFIECKDLAASLISKSITQQVEDIIATKRAEYKAQYYSTCSDPAMLLEKFSIGRYETLYHYTLYYYDRAGNLIRTVPPEGIPPAKLPASTSTNIANSRLLLPSNTMVTEYQYNTMGQLIREHSPDGNYDPDAAAEYVKPTATDDATLNASKYYATHIYNDKGQIRFSRNAKQKKDGTYSYTKYDELGRIIEVGQGVFDEPTMMAKRNEFGENSYPYQVAVTFVTKSVYNNPFASLPGGYVQDLNNLRNRISYTYTDADGLDNPSPNDRVYTIYNYDPHGNISWLVQAIPGMPAIGIKYEYDLISGKVTQVDYNPSTPEFHHKDEFYQRYSYDANNRIKKVQTSKDGYIWETEACYKYYLHGPLKRVTLGEDLVQGVDYTYTIHGWLKAINHQLLDKTTDPGQDAVGTSQVGRDVFGQNLRFYLGDYNFSGSPFEDSNLSNIKPATGLSLYNGNIAASSANTLNAPVKNPGLFGFQYKYDVLNRLLSATAQAYSTTNGDYAAPAAHVLAYSSTYSYSPNGNIKTALTYGSLESGDANGSLDYLTYNYTAGTNRLSYASDAFSTSTPWPSDIEPGQTANNYKYDPIGNLTRDEQQQTNISWNPYGKVEKVVKDSNAKTEFLYDASGNRIAKKQTNINGTIAKTNFYVRDAGGNTMAIYEKTEQSGIEPEIVMTEMSIFGSDRLGTYTTSVSVDENEQTSLEAGEVRISQNGTRTLYEDASYLVNPTKILTLGPGFSYNSIGSTDWFKVRVAKSSGSVASDIYTRSLDSRRYEMKDHLGNVRALISDIKLSSLTANVPGNYGPQLLAANNYYPFGLDMPGRTSPVGGKYRYGFNGKEKDLNMEWGSSTNYDYGFRIYNPALGKFLSVDPLTKEYPWYTPYQFAGNKPINSIDRDGLEEFESYTAYKMAKGDAALKVMDGSDGAWLRAHRGLQVVSQAGPELSETEYNEVFARASKFNLDNLKTENYETLPQRQQFYNWFDDYSKSLGYETKWSAAAEKTVSDLNLLLIPGLPKAFGSTNEEINSFVRAGNKRILDDMMPRMKALLDGPVLKGEDAVTWDAKTLVAEQNLIQMSYLKLSQASINILEANVKQTSKSAKIVGAFFGNIPFKGSLKSVGDRWKFGMSKMKYNMNDADFKKYSK